MQRKKIIKPLILLFVTLFFGINLSSCHDQQKKPTQPPVTVNAIKITTQEVPIFYDYIGMTKSVAEITLRARVKGFLTQADFVEGAPVKRGQLLFVIDPRSYQVALDQAKAQLEFSIANKEYQSIQIQRMTRLVATGAISRETYDKTKAEYQQAIAQVGVNQAQVEQAKLNLSYCYTYSPVDGKIGQILVDVGNLVGGTTDTQLATVVQLNPIYVNFSPSVEDFAQILKHSNNRVQKVVVTLPGNESLKFNGKVDLINNKADQNTSTLLMRAVLENPNQLLIPGVYVNLRLFLGNNPAAILIPTKALMETQGRQYVYTLDKNNTVVTKNVKSNRIYQGQSIIQSGLQAEDIVVIDDLQKLQPGMVVAPKMITSNQ